MTEADHDRCRPDALKLLGDYWVLRIVEELHLAGDGLRFSELQRALGGASPATLSNRLRRLEDENIVDREDATGRLSVRYELSEHGQSVLPVIRAIHAFSSGSGAPSELSPSPSAR